MPEDTPEGTAAAGRRVPLRFVNDQGQNTVRTNTQRTEHGEGVPEEWASLPADRADQWDATCWFSLDTDEAGRPEMLRTPLRPGGTS
ncbi:hypothetical protein KUM39_26245 [Streptomyces sp. J2-1]|uniref:hypothetical protein n=1 Tax=Streptomyces corallincola TaxID=2851888 RepID=UPI001C38CD7A|nr:hypothetical protein [Streptomyces corallincola]MBV2357815.1 hypothetical protein [Streptomyces corallincola]